MTDKVLSQVWGLNWGDWHIVLMQPFIDRSIYWFWKAVVDPGGLTGVITPPPPWTCPDPENLCRVCVTAADHPPPLGMWMTSHGQCARGVLVNVQEWGWFSNFRRVFSIFRRADDVTQTMSKGGVLVNVLKAQGDDVTQAMSKGSGNTVSAPERVDSYRHVLLFGIYERWPFNL